MLQDFLTGRPGAATARTPATDAAGPETGFQSLLTARTGDLPSGGTTRRIEARDAAEGLEAPEIEVVQEGGVVRRIIVTCTCCQRIELECAY